MAIQPKATDDPDAAPVEDRIRALRARIDPLMGAEVNSEVERQIKIENGVAPKTREDLDRA